MTRQVPGEYARTRRGTCRVSHARGDRIVLFSAAAELARSPLGADGEYRVGTRLFDFRRQNLSHMELADRLFVRHQHPVPEAPYLVGRLRNVDGDGVSIIHGADPFAPVAAVDDPGLDDAAPFCVAPPLLELDAEVFVERADEPRRHKARGEGRDDKLLLLEAGVEIIVGVLLPSGGDHRALSDFGEPDFIHGASLRQYRIMR